LATRGIEQIAELLEKPNALTVEVHQHIYHCVESPHHAPALARDYLQAPQ
jgi:hypothetical protein